MEIICSCQKKKEEKEEKQAPKLKGHHMSNGISWTPDELQ